jgi:hypothetical protein
MFAFFLGFALLCMGIIPLLASFLMCLFESPRDALWSLPGALLVFFVMSFIGYNTLAVEIGWNTIV